MTEFAPAWGGARMTKAQVKKYIQDMRKAQIIAQAKLEQAKISWEFKKEELELAEIEKQLDEYYS